MRKIDALIAERTERRLELARTRVERILQEASRRGIEISVVGSLARDRFRLHSDVDLVVHGDTDPERRMTVERLVADQFRDTDIPYDLIFASDMTADRLRDLLDDSV
jgi:predicted nucleotidyltransferase